MINIIFLLEDEIVVKLSVMDRVFFVIAWIAILIFIFLTIRAIENKKF